MRALRGRFVGLPLALLMVGVQLGCPGAPTPVSAPPDPPQLVVLYILDALRADHVGGRGWTPVLDRLANEGVSFTDYVSVAPSTMTATKTLFSGRFFLDGGGLPAGVETLAEVLSGAGFATLGVSGNGHVSSKYGMTRGFDAFEMVFPGARGADPATYVNRNAAEVHRCAVEMLSEAPAQKPVFLYLHTIHPHAPYAPPRGLANEMCGDIPSSLDGMSPTLLAVRDGELEVSADDERRLACLYAASVRYNDAEIGRFLTELEQRWRAEEILFIVTSDHGEELFDHGGVLHGHTLYDELLKVPLVFRWPGRLAPSTIDLPSDTFDLHETLRALVGAAASSARAEGRSLWPVMVGADGSEVESRHRFAAAPTLAGGLFMARSDRHKLVLAPRGGMGLGLGRNHDPEYLFDLWRDPGERTNLVGRGVPEEGVLRAELRAWIERTGGGGGSEEVILDDETREHLEALGYVE
jgi:arylsulfatase A-like enzyme